MLEIKRRDGLGRLAKWNTPRGKVALPDIAIVVNPNKQLIPIKELVREFKPQILMTNSYIIRRSKISEKIEKKGLHKFLAFNGLIYTDSGAFQFYSRGIKDFDPEEIIEFQKKIGSDVITPLDLFTFQDDSKGVVEKKLKETVKRIRSVDKGDRLLVGPIQGGRFLDLRRRAARLVMKENVDVFAIGGLVPLMENYEFKSLVEQVIVARNELAVNKPIHAFGCGHPMVFSLLVLLGFDLFDSAMYSIAAENDRYLTPEGTLRLEDIEELPCSCPVCSSTTASELKKMNKGDRAKMLARHNLYVILGEIRKIRQAIAEGSLFELVQQRVRAHPSLLEAFTYVLKKYGKFIEEYDPVTKRSAFLYSGPESEFRPEVMRAKKQIKHVKAERFFEKEPFGNVPLGLKYVYPFGQSLGPGKEVKKEPSHEEWVRQVIEYQFGRGASKFFKPLRIRKSPVTGMPRRVFVGGQFVGAIRPNDGFFITNMKGAELIKKATKRPKNRVVINDDAAPFVRDGKSVFVKFVVDCDPNLRPWQEIFVVDKKDRLIATGTALLNAREIKGFERHVAVRIRHH